VIDITLRPVSTGVSLLAATIQATGDSVAFSHGEPATLLSEVLGQGGKIEGVTLKPMPSSGLWIMTGFRRVDVCDLSGLVASSETRPAPADEMYSGGSLEQRARALCSLAADAKAGETGEEEEEVSDSGFGASDDGDGAGHAVHHRTRRFLGAGTRPPWEELDKERLLVWARGISRGSGYSGSFQTGLKARYACKRACCKRHGRDGAKDTVATVANGGYFGRLDFRLRWSDGCIRAGRKSTMRN
jgi:hypothetical protein